MYRTHSRAFARVSEHVRYALGAHVLKRLAYEVSADLVVYADRVHGEVVSTTRYDYRNTSVPFLQLPDTIYQIPACPCEEPLATEQRFRLARTEDIGHAASEIPTRHLVWRHDPTRQGSCVRCRMHATTCDPDGSRRWASIVKSPRTFFFWLAAI